MSELDLFKRRFERERAARREAEELLENRSRALLETNENLSALAARMREEAERTKAIVEAAAEGIMTYHQDGRIESMNRSALNMFGHTSVRNLRIQDLFQMDASVNSTLFGENAETDVQTNDAARDAYGREICAVRSDKSLFSVEASVSRIESQGQPVFIVLVRDLTRRKTTEAKLAQAQKMESVGQLAAGVAHEINTPIQFVGDNLNFIAGAFEDIASLMELYHALYELNVRNDDTTSLLEKIGTQVELVDLPFLKQEFPSAIAQSNDGVERVAAIVRTMKEFSQPSTDAREACDLNRMIRNVIALSASRWREHGDVVFDSAELPAFICSTGQMNHAILNLLTNAIDSIAQRWADSKQGRIAIASALREDMIELRFQDNGIGIPQDIQCQLFDPFFSTKKAGVGSGQGLSFVYSVVVDQHLGSIQVNSQEGQGAEFVLRLPVAKEIVEVPA